MFIFIFFRRLISVLIALFWAQLDLLRLGMLLYFWFTNLQSPLSLSQFNAFLIQWVWFFQAALDCICGSYHPQTSQESRSGNGPSGHCGNCTIDTSVGGPTRSNVAPEDITIGTVDSDKLQILVVVFYLCCSVVNRVTVTFERFPSSLFLSLGHLLE